MHQLGAYPLKAATPRSVVFWSGNHLFWYSVLVFLKKKKPMEIMIDMKKGK